MQSILQISGSVYKFLCSVSIMEHLSAAELPYQVTNTNVLHNRRNNWRFLIFFQTSWNKVSK